MNAALESKRDELTRLCLVHGVQDLYAFGSAVHGGFIETVSDYDFLVRFKPCTPTEHAARYLGLLQDLKDAFVASIDLVEYDAITNPYFRKQVESSRVTIYAA